MTFPNYPNVDYSDLPLLPAWYTPAWTSQNDAYVVRPSDLYSAVPFPNLNYVLVTGEEFDFDGNPLGGYFTFMPSDNATVQTTDENGNTVYNRIAKRYTGSDVFDQYGYNQAGSGRVYLWRGRLSVLLLATDNTMTTDQGAPLFYYVKEHFQGGQEYQIQVPWNTVGAGPVDIRGLITSGPNIPGMDFLQPVICMNAMSTENVVTNISSVSASMQNINLAFFDVNFAFTLGFSQPAEDDWQEGTWLPGGPPYIASILVGPNNGVIAPNPGTYTIWVRVVTPTELPVLKVGTLIIES